MKNNNATVNRELCRVYRTSISYKETGAELLFDTDFRQLQAATANEYRMSLDSNNFFVDGYEPENYIDRLAVTVGRALYPLDITIDRQTGSLQKINNLEFLRERWEEKRTALELEHGGELVESYLQQMTESLNDEEELLDNLRQKSVLLNFLIFPLQFNLVPGQTIKSTLFFPAGSSGERFEFMGSSRVDIDKEKGTKSLFFDGETEHYGVDLDGNITVTNFKMKLEYDFSSLGIVNDVWVDVYKKEQHRTDEEEYQIIRIHYLRERY